MKKLFGSFSEQCDCDNLHEEVNIIKLNQIENNDNRSTQSSEYYEDNIFDCQKSIPDCYKEDEQQQQQQQQNNKNDDDDVNEGNKEFIEELERLKDMIKMKNNEDENDENEGEGEGEENDEGINKNIYDIQEEIVKHKKKKRFEFS